MQNNVVDFIPHNVKVVHFVPQSDKVVIMSSILCMSPSPTQSHGPPAHVIDWTPTTGLTTKPGLARTCS